MIDVQDLDRARERLAAQPETIKAGDILLLRTDWAQRAIGTPIYFPQSPGLTEAAARWLVEKQPKCIGCDFFQEREMAFCLLGIGACPSHLVVLSSSYCPVCQYDSTEFFTVLRGI